MTEQSKREDAVDMLFKEAMVELKDIKKEIVNMNQKLTLTIERQSVSNENIEKIEKRVEACENHMSRCPARKSYESKVTVVKDFTAVIAIVLSLIALWNIFKGG